MSRFVKKPIEIPKTVQLSLGEGYVNVKGPRGELRGDVPRGFAFEREGDHLWLRLAGAGAESGTGMRLTKNPLLGTVYVRVRNMIRGVEAGFERRLLLVGVGYRAQLQGKQLNLSLGFSHPVLYPIPEGIKIEMPSPTEIVIRGIDKQQVGRVASEIRRIRPVESYKGKGVRYEGERVRLKETKKK